MAAVYTYRVEGLCKAPAEVAGRVCETLEHSEAGLTPASLVNVSRDAKAPLHDEFEWDDNKAGELYRLNQAAGIIRNLRVTVQTQDSAETTRAFVNIRTEEEPSNYVSLSRTLDNDAWRGQLLASAKREMQCFIAKFKTLSEVASVIAEMEKSLA